MKSLQIVLLILAIGVSINLLSGCQEQVQAEPSSQTKIVPQVKLAEVKEAGQQAEAGAVKGNPIVKVENPIHDFGQVGPGTYNDCEFKFKNVGDGVLKINKIKAPVT